MSTEELVFYWIGRGGFAAALGVATGSLIWWVSSVVSDSLVVLRAKADRIRKGEE